MKKLVEFDVYVDKNNQPTCSLNYQTKEYCQFLGQRHFGQQPYCLALCEDVNYKFDKKCNPIDYLRPLENCPLWKK